MWYTLPGNSGALGRYRLNVGEKRWSVYFLSGNNTCFGSFQQTIVLKSKHNMLKHVVVNPL